MKLESVFLIVLFSTTKYGNTQCINAVLKSNMIYDTLTQSKHENMEFNGSTVFLFDSTMEFRNKVELVPPRYSDYDGKWILFKYGKCWIEATYKNNMLEGDVVYFYYDGLKKQEYKYKNGLRNGLHITYSDSGEKSSELMYINDTLNGVSNYYSYGRKTKSSHYINGAKEGIDSGWVDGQLRHIAEYKNGKRNGCYISWDFNGDLKEIQYFRNDSSYITSIYFEDNKVKKQTYYTNGIWYTSTTNFYNNKKYTKVIETKSNGKIFVKYLKKKRIIKEEVYEIIYTDCEITYKLIK